MIHRMSARHFWLGAGGSMILHAGILAAVFGQIPSASVQPETRTIMVELVRPVPHEARPGTPVSETVSARPQTIPAVEAPQKDPVRFPDPEPFVKNRPIPHDEVSDPPAVRAASTASGTGTGGKETDSDDMAGVEQGYSGDATGLPAAYLNDLRGRLERAKRYPWLARLRGIEGTSLVRFAISGTGELQDVGVVRSSAHRVLDEAAVDTVRRAAPFPGLPGGAGLDRVEINVPVVFELRSKGD